MVEVVAYTDPLCPWSWGAEPVLRRLEVEFSGQVAFTYVMAGMAREIDPGPKLESTLEVVAETGMPADPRVWTEDPPHSSYPACLAVAAAAEQGAGAAMLRRLREGTLLRRERLDHPEALVAAARDLPALDPDAFRADLASGAVLAHFEADRKRSRAACGDHRPALPGFCVDGGPVLGTRDLRAAVAAAGAHPGELPDPAGALERFGAMATAEVAEVCGLATERASAELWRLADASRARVERHVCGETWSVS